MLLHSKQELILGINFHAPKQAINRLNIKYISLLVTALIMVITLLQQKKNLQYIKKFGKISHLKHKLILGKVLYINNMFTYLNCTK